MKLLYYSAVATGGLADYAHAQANALAQLGIEVTMLCPADAEVPASTRYKRVPELVPFARRIAFRRLQQAGRIIRNIRFLERHIRKSHFSHVLLGSYSEYLSPLWANRLTRLAREGIVFGAVVHDPVRDFVLGPRWWHRWSIACAYSFLQEAFVHGEIALDTAQRMPELHTTVVPHGQTRFPPGSQGRQITRKQLDLPSTATVLLAFGHVRDGKNLDLILKAMRAFPAIYLVVAGKEQSSGQRRLNYYQKIAKSFGVAERCRWWNDYVPESKVGDLFEASDIVLLTYSRQFVSASSVLGAAVQFRRLCLASSGDGPVREVVTKYRLGKWVEPDSMEAIEAGLQCLIQNPTTPDWDSFSRENSWEANARIVAERMFEDRLH